MPRLNTKNATETLVSTDWAMRIKCVTGSTRNSRNPTMMRKKATFLKFMMSSATTNLTERVQLESTFVLYCTWILHSNCHWCAFKLNWSGRLGKLYWSTHEFLPWKSSWFIPWYYRIDDLDTLARVVTNRRVCIHIHPRKKQRKLWRCLWKRSLCNRQLSSGRTEPTKFSGSR